MEMSPLVEVASTAELFAPWPAAPPLPIAMLIAPFAVVAEMPGPALPLTRPEPVVIVRAPA